MAIQNFIGGGFKGKLGATIGQGWKNKKVIRTAFVPSNPRTAKQQSNRKDFAECVKMAQLAMQMDFRGVGFSSENNTEWALRISSARKYFNKNLPAMYCIPLIPYGTVAKYAVSDDFEVSGNTITFKIETEDDLTSRGVSVLLYLKNSETEEYEYFVIQSSVTGVSGDWTFSANIPNGFEVAENSLACAISNDDEVLTTKIYRSPFSIFSPIVDIPFTLSNPVVTPIATGDTKRTITFTTSAALESASLDITGVSASGVMQGFRKNVLGKIVSAGANLITVELFTNVLDDLNQLVQFPTGSSVTIPAFSFTVGTNRYVYAGGTFSPSETPVIQTFYDFDSLNKTVGSSAVSFAFESDVDSSTTTAVSDVPCVSNGKTTLISADFMRATDSTGKGVLLVEFFRDLNYWGKERSGVMDGNVTFTVLGVTYTIPAGTSIPLEPYATLVTVDVNSLSLAMTASERDEYISCYGVIGDAAVAPVASLWGSHAKPSVSITSEGVTYDVGQPSSISAAGGIRINYPRDAWYLPSNGTAVATFSEAFVEEKEVAYSDGFILRLSVSVGSISGTYTFIPNE